MGQLPPPLNLSRRPRRAVTPEEGPEPGRKHTERASPAAAPRDCPAGTVGRLRRHPTGKRGKETETKKLLSRPW